MTLSASEAWAVLAMLWDRPFRRSIFLAPRAMVTDDGAVGLCQSISQLHMTGEIRLVTKRKMQRQLFKHFPGRVDYFWSLDERGAEARARFCWLMAREAEGEARCWTCSTTTTEAV